jgi:hypothetical protein
MTPTLVLIGGSPWVGKTTVAERLFSRLNNSAWLDGDNVWCVNPFSLSDPRLRNSDRNMAFVLNTYIQCQFQYVIFSSVVLTDSAITQGILSQISSTPFEVVSFTLGCDEATLAARCASRKQTSPQFDWLRASLTLPDTIHIDTSAMLPEEVSERIGHIAAAPAAAGLTRNVVGGIPRWV